MGFLKKLQRATTKAQKVAVKAGKIGKRMPTTAELVFGKKQRKRKGRR
jgi:hypothetical protein